MDAVMGHFLAWPNLDLMLKIAAGNGITDGYGQFNCRTLPLLTKASARPPKQ